MTEDDVVENYDAAGRLISLVRRDGQRLTLSYTNGLLANVSDNFGRTLSFTYVDGRIDTLTDPAGGVYRYAYAPDGFAPETYNLRSVTYPDGKTRRYAYDGTYQDFSRSLNLAFANALAQVSDENGHVYSTWSYDEQGRVNGNELGGGIAGKFTLNFADGVTYVTDPLGNRRTYRFVTQHDVTKVASIDGSPCPSCGGQTQAATYDTNGFLSTSTDFNGNGTQYVYNPRGLIERKTEAVGTSDERTTNTAWHASYRVPACEQTALRTTLFDYNTRGQLTQRIGVDTTDPALFPDANSKTCASVQSKRSAMLSAWNTRIWSYSYYETGARLGLRQSEDGPLPPDANGVSDVTSYLYDEATGNLTEIQRPYGQTTRITAHDPHGRPTVVIDPNGLTTRLSYTLRGWLDAVQVGTDATGFELTDYSYDAVGNLTAIALPSGERLSYRYDTAHRLTQISDQDGNRIDYVLDAAGNRTEAKTYDPNGTLKRKQSFVYDQASRLRAIENASDTAVQKYTYDANGNQKTSTDPIYTTTNGYDALNRLKTVTDPLNGVATYNYDADDRITAVTDPNGNTTRYTYDGLGNLKRLQSPDTGITDYSTYDAAGNLLRQTDARGVTVTYQYDALSRLTRISYPTETATVYSYDTCTNGRGRLCKVTDSSGSTEWQYDTHGRVTAKTQTSGTLSFTVRYRYQNGRLKTVTYPSGLEVTNIRSAGKVAAVDTSLGRLMQGLAYDPFGPLTTWTYDNGQAMQRLYDQDGHLDRYTRGNALYNLDYDLRGNITRQTNPIDSSKSQSYGYDELSRLTTFNSGQIVYSYDLNGNRTREQNGGQTTDYTIDPTSNRLLQVGATPYSYDGVGNTLDNGQHRFRYNEHNRLAAVDVDTSNEMHYHYNALGQRTAKLGSQAPRPGDANGDGRIDRDDLYRVVDTLLERKAANTREDCDGDNTVTDKDMLCVNTRAQAEPDVPASARIYFVYDESGQLLGEYDAEGKAIQEIVWLDTMPVAVIKAQKVYYVHSDQLHTPRVITDAQGKMVWRWDSDPFGAAQADEDPDGDGAEFGFSGRFHGQYTDSEAQSNYNYFRNYSPVTGRYLQVDPIGLIGGINTYAYVANDPLRWVDALGLDKTEWDRPGSRNGRSTSSGPRNGNWGGKDWSGGQNPEQHNSESGSLPPTDSADGCYMKHDICWTFCDIEGGGRRCKRSCDRVLVRCLDGLGDNCESWPSPPRKGTEKDTLKFRNDARNFFSPSLQPSPSLGERSDGSGQIIHNPDWEMR